MPNVKLFITDIESHDPRPFGPSGTLHYPLMVSEPLGNETMVAMISENVLRRAGISEHDLDSIVGSHLDLQDAKSLDGTITTAEERIDDVLSEIRPFLLVSQANGRIIKSDVLKEETKRQSKEIKALIAVEQQRERDFKKKQVALANMLARKNGATPAPAPQTPAETPAKDATAPAEKTTAEASLEKNDADMPF